MKVTIVQEVDYDGGRIGKCWRMAVCATPAATGRMIDLYTKPVRYHDGVCEFEPHVHRETWGVIIGYRGPVPTFVFSEEKEVIE